MQEMLSMYLTVIISGFEQRKSIENSIYISAITLGKASILYSKTIVKQIHTEIKGCPFFNFFLRGGDISGMGDVELNSIQIETFPQYYKNKDKENSLNYLRSLAVKTE